MSYQLDDGCDTEPLWPTSIHHTDIYRSKKGCE